MSNDIYMTRNKAKEIQFDSQQIEIIVTNSRICFIFIKS